MIKVKEIDHLEDYFYDWLIRHTDIEPEDASGLTDQIIDLIREVDENGNT